MVEQNMKLGRVTSELFPLVTLLHCLSIIVHNCTASSYDPVSHPANFLQSLGSLRTQDNKFPMQGTHTLPMG